MPLGMMQVLFGKKLVCHVEPKSRYEDGVRGRVAADQTNAKAHGHGAGGRGNGEEGHEKHENARAHLL